MNMKRIVGIICAVGVLGTASLQAEPNLILRSAIFPGMGQIGSDQVGKGLLYMGGEIALLSLMFGNIAKKSAYERDTEYLKARMDLARTAEEQREIKELWDQRYNDDAPQARTLAIAFGGGAAVWWIWNVLDCIIFPPKNDDEYSLYRSIKDNTEVSFSREFAKLSMAFSF